MVKSGRSDVALGMLPAGTGNDFGKSLGVTFERAEDVVRGIAAGRRRTVDIGRVEGRHFLNVVGLGFDIAVIDDAADFPLLKGDALYQVCALRQLFRFRGIPLSVSAADTPPASRDHLMLVIANANYFGGSFHIAPRASLEDGMLDAVSIYDAGPLARARLFKKVAKGRHEGEDKVKIQQSGAFRIECEGTVRYEVDGEVYTSRGSVLEVRSLPQALTVFVPES
jgi:diacylglycerol kinase (ATP)